MNRTWEITENPASIDEISEINTAEPTDLTLLSQADYKFSQLPFLQRAILASLTKFTIHQGVQIRHVVVFTLRFLNMARARGFNRQIYASESVLVGLLELRKQEWVEWNYDSMLRATSPERVRITMRAGCGQVQVTKWLRDGLGDHGKILSHLMKTFTC